MADTDVNLRIRSQGAENAINAFGQLSASMAGLGQVVRLIGPEFDRLGQSITNVAAAAGGLSQIGGILGAFFGPAGRGIGTALGGIGGALLGIGLESGFFGGGEPAPTTQRIENNVQMNIGIEGASADEITRVLSEEVKRAISNERLGGFREGGINEFTNIQTRISRR